ncbi:MAG TPA: hypothetical protein VJH33_03420 [Candidatus Paceibacterota bacterium]
MSSYYLLWLPEMDEFRTADWKRIQDEFRLLCTSHPAFTLLL